MLYRLLKKCVGLFFNTLNLLLAGNLPPLTCAGVVVEEEGRYLVILTPDELYAFPGGFMRWREHPEQTTQRECKEETGLHIRVGGVFGYYSITSQSASRMSTLTLYYRGSMLGGTLRKSVEGQPFWLSADELQGKLTPFHKIVFNDYLEAQSQPDREMAVRQF